MDGRLAASIAKPHRSLNAEETAQEDRCELGEVGRVAEQEAALGGKSEFATVSTAVSPR
jgi:hypothetical protein